MSLLNTEDNDFLTLSSSLTGILISSAFVSDVLSISMSLFLTLSAITGDFHCAPDVKLSMSMRARLVLP